MKTKQVNKIKINIFEEKELGEKLRLNDNQVKLILDYQENFPELLQKKDGFCISARNLHSKLNVGAEYATWMKRRISKYKFEESVDFTTFDKSVKAQNTYINTKEYYITLNMAKELCMVENNEIGKDVRKYFILIEETLRNYENWELSRGIEKDGWNKMSKCIEDWCKRKELDYTIRKFYTREANLLNESLLGFPATEINWMLKNNDKITRDHLDVKINNALNFLQELNCSLLFSDMEFEERKLIIETTCKNKYLDLKIEFQEFVGKVNKKVV